MKDWIGNKKSTFTTMGATGHSQTDREENDYYATDPKALDLLLNIETFDNNIWEPACGGGTLAEVLKRHGYNVYSTDIIDRGCNDDTFDFLKSDVKFNGDIITNPPYKFATEFVKHSLDCIEDGHKVAMFLKLTFLETKGRRELFEKDPFETLYVSSSRLRCAKNGDFNFDSASATAYGWYIWKKGFSGTPQIKWFN